MVEIYQNTTIQRQGGLSELYRECRLQQYTNLLEREHSRGKNQTGLYIQRWLTDNQEERNTTVLEKEIEKCTPLEQQVLDRKIFMHHSSDRNISSPTHIKSIVNYPRCIIYDQTEGENKATIWAALHETVARFGDGTKTVSRTVIRRKITFADFTSTRQVKIFTLPFETMRDDFTTGVYTHETRDQGKTKCTHIEFIQIAKDVVTIKLFKPQREDSDVFCRLNRNTGKVNRTTYGDTVLEGQAQVEKIGREARHKLRHVIFPPYYSDSTGDGYPHKKVNKLDPVNWKFAGNFL